MGMTIAAAIGLHNFAEGLAIGVAANSGDVGLATVLIVGFAVHNTTEGFGIVGPHGDVRPSWSWLIVAGIVGGAPTFLGSIVGYQVDSDTLSLLFYSLSAGAILYVIGEIWNAMRRLGHRELGLVMIAAGVFLGAPTAVWANALESSSAAHGWITSCSSLTSRTVGGAASAPMTSPIAGPRRSSANFSNASAVSQISKTRILPPPISPPQCKMSPSGGFPPVFTFSFTWSYCSTVASNSCSTPTAILGLLR
jgi:hypothetical protein